MNKNVSLALAIGAGVIGLIVVHSILSGQSAAASAIQVGATITSPFNISGDTSGSLVNDASTPAPTAASSTGVSDGGAAATAANDGGSFIVPTVPNGVPIAGWGAALSGMNDIASGHLP